MDWLFIKPPLPKDGTARIMHLLDVLDLDQETRLEALKMFLWQYNISKIVDIMKKTRNLAANAKFSDSLFSFPLSED